MTKNAVVIKVSSIDFANIVLDIIPISALTLYLSVSYFGRSRLRRACCYGNKIKLYPLFNDKLRCWSGDYKGKFCKSKISTLVARDPLLVWIPAPSTHSADPSVALRASAKSGQALLRTGFAGMTVFNRFLDSASLRSE
jgi:hypothetical protein